MSGIKSKETLFNNVTKLISGIKLHCAGQTLVLKGVPMKAEDIVAQLEALIAALLAVPPARQTLGDKVKAVDDLLPSANKVIVGVHDYVQTMFGNSKITLGDFGMTPRAVGKKTVAVKTAAVQKSALTRVARHTMGVKQKAQIHGAASAAPEPAAPAAATAASPAPAVKPS